MNYKVAEKLHNTGSKIRRAEWQATRIFMGEELSSEDQAALDWVEVSIGTGAAANENQDKKENTSDRIEQLITSRETTLTLAVDSGDETTLFLQSQPIGFRKMRKVSGIYAVELEAKDQLSGQIYTIDTIESIKLSDPTAALPISVPDKKSAKIKAKKAAVGVTVTAKCMVIVSGALMELTATSAPFDIVEDDGMIDLMDDSGNPVIDPATGKVKQVKVPTLSIVVAE